MILERVERYIEALIKREGGFVDHADDPGGATRWGITERVARRHGFEGHMRRFPKQAAREIYLKQYWQGPRFDDVARLSPMVAEELFDTGVNMGPAAAGKFLQRALNALNKGGELYEDVKVDGHVGERTLDALQGYLNARAEVGETVLCKALDCLQGAEYIALSQSNPDLESFVFGWLRTRVGSDS